MQLVRTVSRTQLASRPATPHEVTKKRWPAMIVFILCVGLLGVARWLEPSEKGLGTHQQLGLPACGFHLSTGIPCATCGMTTSFSYATRGRMIRSMQSQPAGMILAVLVTATAIVSGCALFTGASLSVLGVLWRPISVAVMATILLGSWIYKILVEVL